MFKQIKKGKMLEMEASKPTWCGGTVNEECAVCQDDVGGAWSRYAEAFDENKEYWGE